MKKITLKSLVAQRDELNRQISQLMAERLSPGTIVHVKDGALCRDGKKDPCALTRIPDTSIFCDGKIPFRVTCRRGHVVYLKDVNGWNNAEFTYHARVKDIIKVL